MWQCIVREIPLKLPGTTPETVYIKRLNVGCFGFVDFYQNLDVRKTGKRSDDESSRKMY